MGLPVVFTQVSDFPDLTLWMKSLTGHSARTWAHRVTPGSDEPGPFCRRAPRPAAAYPPRLPQDEQPHPPLPGADRGCRGHPVSGADAEPPGLGPLALYSASPEALLKAKIGKFEYLTTYEKHRNRETWA